MSCRNTGTDRAHGKRPVRESGLCFTCEIAARRQKARDRRGKQVQGTYGLSPAQHEELFRLQGGRCPHGRRITLRSPVDHDHRSGAVRGLMCDPCNRFLGYVRDQPQAFLNLWAYATRPPAQYGGISDHAFMTERGLFQCTFRENSDDHGDFSVEVCGRLKHEHHDRPALPDMDPVLKAKREAEETSRGELNSYVALLRESHANGTSFMPGHTQIRERLWQRVSLYGIEPTDTLWRSY